jgi:hypothetical protein
MAELTAERLRKLLHYDPLTGTFTRLQRIGVSTAVGDVAGSIAKDGYVRIRVDGVRYYAHRLAWLHVAGSWPSLEIDHRDGHRANNRWTNLREATDALNRANQRFVRSDSKTGVIGVRPSHTTGKCTAQIKVGGAPKHLGTFTNAADASAAYWRARGELVPAA